MWYILVRDGAYWIDYVNGNDPLYGRGSWGIAAGPFDTFQKADNYYANEMGAPGDPEERV